MGEATPIIATPIGSSPSSSLLEAQAAWARRHSNHPHRHRRRHRRSNLADLSFSLFWWLVVLIVGGWLILVDGGRLIGLWV